MNGTISAYAAGPGAADGRRRIGGRQLRWPRTRRSSTEFKLLLKDSPNYIGVAKGEDKLRLKVNEIIAAAKASGELNKICLKWLGRPIGDLPG